MKVGVLAIQGGFQAHARALADVGAEPVLVRTPAALAGLGGLILPGGESTAQLKLVSSAGLAGPLGALVARGVPVLATCAGLILAARHVTHPPQASFGWLGVSVARNAWGRQLDSFEAVADDGVTPLTFIRAPRIVEVSPAARVLLSLGREPVLVRQGNVVGATYHPELTPDRRLHRELFGS